jgi:methyl-accepting chemotaxis protein
LIVAAFLVAHLPMKVGQMLGQTIDMFPKQPEHQRRLLGDTRNLPRTATIRVGPELFELSVSAMVDQKQPLHRPDDHLGGRDRATRGQGPRGGTGRQHHGGQPVAPGLGRARTVRDVITAALGSVRGAFTERCAEK